MPFNLHVNFGGLDLNSPVVVGASPMSLNETTRRAMQTAGAGAIVLPSLFEEQLIQWSLSKGRSVTDREKAILAQAQHVKHNWACVDAEAYLAQVNRASTNSSVPIIASLNGFTAGGWTDFAGELQEVGAAAIELNVHHAKASEYASSAEIESTILDSVREINAAIDIPLFVKLNRNFTSIPHLARQLLSGAQGLVMHGRAPTVDICLDTLKLATRWELTPEILELDSLDLLMQVHGYCPAMPLAASGGIGQSDQIIKTLLAGADVAMVTSVVYREGPDVIRKLLDGLTNFMERHQITNLRELQSQRPLEFTNDEDRAAYIAALGAHLDATDIQVAEPSMQGDR